MKVAFSVPGKLRLPSFLPVIPLLFVAALAAGCATLPPAQEMSDARQAMQAAREAQAEHFAPESFLRAQAYLDQATRDLQSGNYESARRNALAAKAAAATARDRALQAER